MTKVAIIVSRIAAYFLGGRYAPSQPLPFNHQHDIDARRAEITAGTTASFAWTVDD
jgi:hypothetical protein